MPDIERRYSSEYREVTSPYVSRDRARSANANELPRIPCPNCCRMTPSIGKYCGYCGKRIDSINKEQNADTAKEKTKHTEEHFKAEEKSGEAFTFNLPVQRWIAFALTCLIEIVVVFAAGEWFGLYSTTISGIAGGLLVIVLCINFNGKLDKILDIVLKVVEFVIGFFLFERIANVADYSDSIVLGILGILFPVWCLTFFFFCGGQRADTAKQQTKHTENHKPPKGIVPAVIGIILGIFSLLVLTDGLFGLFDSTDAQRKSTNTYSVKSDAKNTLTEKEKIAAEILAVLGTEKAKLNDVVETRATYIDAIKKVFKSMTWDFYKSQEDTYRVTFTGTYYPNYQVVQYTQEGDLSLSVNLRTGSIYGLSGEAAPGINVYLADRL